MTPLDTAVASYFRTTPQAKRTILILESLYSGLTVKETCNKHSINLKYAYKLREKMQSSIVKSCIDRPDIVALDKATIAYILTTPSTNKTILILSELVQDLPVIGISRKYDVNFQYVYRLKKKNDIK